MNIRIYICSHLLLKKNNEICPGRNSAEASDEAEFQMAGGFIAGEVIVITVQIQIIVQIIVKIIVQTILEIIVQIILEILLSR